MEIVYCGGCGKALREDDFSKGLARTLDNRPWCAECKPPDKKPITGAIPVQRRSGSSAKHPRVTPGLLAAAPDDGSKKCLLIGLAIAGGGLLILLGWLASNNTPAPLPPPDRKTAPPPPPPSNADAERLLKELESFATLAPADKILARCDELRPKLMKTPLERKFLAIEAAAKSQRDETQASRELDDLRKQIDEDPRFEKFDAFVKRFRAAKDLSASRAAEIDRRLADYQKARQESPHQKHLGPFAADEEGFIRHWLVLGVFPNDKDQGLDTDYLKGEATADPVDGAALGNLKWGAYASPEAKIDFLHVAHLGSKTPKDNVVAYAACLVQVPGDVAAEFRMGSDDGGALWVDGKPVGKVHKPRALKRDEDRYAVPLPPGVHRVLVKVENRARNFEFLLRILGPDGQRVPSLRVWN